MSSELRRALRIDALSFGRGRLINISGPLIMHHAIKILINVILMLSSLSFANIIHLSCLKTFIGYCTEYHKAFFSDFEYFSLVQALDYELLT